MEAESDEEITIFKLNKHSKGRCQKFGEIRYLNFQ